MRSATRQWILLVFAAASALIYSIPSSASAEERPISSDIVVTLLGTGGPEPTALRFGPATLVQAGGLNLLFDAGRGVTVRLYQLGISSGKGIDAVFLTHYHSDHVAGLPDLWMTGYMFGPFGSGPVAGLVGIEGGVVSGVINLESSSVEAPDWRPRHDEQYYEA
jgi:ribonuclease Z